MRLQLASRSPRRRELLEQIGVRYTVVTADVVEQRFQGEKPADYVERLALEKARAGFNRSPSSPTLGSDTIVVCDDEVLEKPRDYDDFVAMMQCLSGSVHRVLTAVAIVDVERESLAHSDTEVQFKILSEAEIQQYWSTGEPTDKAGGYAIQGLGGALVERINGSYSGVVGLPLEVLCPMLKTFAVPYWSL